MRAAVFTGASRGIGAALAQRAGPLCCATIEIGRSPPKLAGSRFVQANLAQTAQVIAALEKCEELRQATEVWFFDSAGMLPLATVAEEGFGEVAREAFTVCALTPLAIGASLAASGIANLTIVHLSSGASRRPIAGWGAYGMAKAAASLGWQTFALEQSGVNLHLVDPGVVDTDMQRGLREAGDPAAAPLERLKSPEQAAEEILLKVGFIK